MIYETKREVRGDWVQWIILKWWNHGCFHMLNTKFIFSFLFFVLTYVPLLTIFWTMLTLAHEA
jgi:hypothetical protein